VPTAVADEKDLIVPPNIRRQAGIKPGDTLEFKVSRRKITILAKPADEDEYTPAQRRVIDARLAKARKGPYHGPFNTADEATAFLRKEIRKRTKRKKPPA